MHAEIATRNEEVAKLCRRHGVSRLEIFGSDARGTDFDPARSDADLLVEFDQSQDPAAASTSSRSRMRLPTPWAAFPAHAGSRRREA